MEVLIILFLTLLNGFFSLSEIALVSVKKSRMEHLAAQGNTRALTVLKLLDNPENFLSSVQVGITLIGIISGAYGGATLTDDLEKALVNFAFLGNYVHTVSLIAVIGSITYFTIVIGELVPKTIAMNNSEKIALVCVPIIKYFTFASFPFVKLLSISTKFILKIIGAKEANSDHVSEEELKFLLLNAGKSGVLETEESEVHQNIFSFSDQTAKSLMKHSSEVEWVNANNSKEEIFSQITEFSHSKIIVSDGALENVKGYFRVKDFLEKYNDDSFLLEEIIEDPLFIVQNTPSFKIINSFRQTKQHFGFVIDEYGGLLGIITLHDLIEAIVGDLPDEEDDEDEKIVERENGTFLIDGRTPLFEFNKYFNKEIIEFNHSQYTTIAGFMMDQLKAMPKAGDAFIYDNYKFEIMDIDGRRIDKILLEIIDKSEDLS
jgi:putative hemolysin